MSMSHPKKDIKLQKNNKIAQNGLPGIPFGAEHEYDTLRCHISSQSHAILEKACQITKFRNLSKQVY